MSRRILVTIDAGETTCDGCRYVYWQNAEAYCSVLGGLWLRYYRDACDCAVRLPECIAAEKAARELDAAYTLQAVRTGGVK